jgi:hypothetical protein
LIVKKILIAKNSELKVSELFNNEKFESLDRNQVIEDLGYSELDLLEPVRYFIFIAEVTKLLDKHLFSKNVLNLCYFTQNITSDTIKFVENRCDSIGKYHYEIYVDGYVEHTPTSKCTDIYYLK